MSFRVFIYGAIVALVVGGGALVADALTVSDEESVERMLDDVVADGSAALIDWTDPSVEAVSIQTDARRVEARSADELGDPLGGFDGDEVELVQRSVRVEGDRATAALRVRVDGEVRDARFRLVRDGDERWLVTSVVAR